MNRLKSMGKSLELISLSLWRPGRATPIVADIDLIVGPGRATALIGESGSGKTSIATAIMGLWPGRKAGQVCFAGKEVDAAMRGSDLALMMQDPSASLNPVLTIGYQLREILRFRRGLTKAEAGSEVLAWLERVGLSPSEELARAYVHELSGGMAQRAALAIALACEPHVLITDEPFSALDPKTAADQIELLEKYRSRLGFSLLVITHDPKLAHGLADDVVILKDGRIREESLA